MERTAEPVEPFAVALAHADLLVDAAEERPIVVFVDDLRWVDVPTRRTLVVHRPPPAVRAGRHRVGPTHG